MFGMRKPGSLCKRDSPGALELCADGVVRDMPVAGELVREGAHVAGTLHVVLPAQRIDAHPFASDVGGRHGEIRDAHHHGRALAVLGDAQAVVNGAVAARGVEPRRRAHVARRHAGDLLHRLGRVARLGDESAPLLEGVHLAARADELLLDQPSGDDDVSEWS